MLPNWHIRLVSFNANQRFTVEYSDTLLGKLKDVDKKGALSRLDILSRGWREILPSDTLRELSTRLVETYELRAADNFQLAAALTWCQQRPGRRTFICADQRLSKSAAAAGFAVVELS
jgi:hypothetical protein